jgi:hypothetical protein
MRSTASIALALLMVLGSVTLTSANDNAVERFTFARPPAPASTIDPPDRLGLVIDRWSTDAERDTLARVMAESGQAKLLDAFWNVGRVGTLKWPGGLEYAVRYARRTARTDGGSDVVLVVERPLWIWWDSKIGSTDDPYSVVQLRLDKDGKGEGRVSFGVPVASDKAAGVTLSNFAQAPALLTDVRRERSS